MTRTRGARIAVRLALLSLALLALLGAAGCSGRPAGSGGSGSGGGGGTLRYALPTPPTTLDPAKVEDGDTIDLLQQVFEGLVMWDTNNHIVPNIAEKIDVSPDGTVYRFHLRDGVKFHNGRKVTASDFVYSYSRAFFPETKSTTAATYLNDIVGAREMLAGKTRTLPGVKAVDDRTLQITIDKSRPYFLAKLTYPTGYVVCKEAIEADGGVVDEKSMIGTGPFKLESFQSGYLVKLAANADYHGGKPVLAGIDRPILPDSESRENAYESAGKDHTDYTDVQRPELPRIQKDPVLSKQLRQFPRANIWYLALNQLAFPPFKDKRVRQAFAMAIDKDELIRLAYRGTAQRATGILPPGVPGYDAKYPGLPYDTAKARALLAAAGYPGGKGFPKLVISFRQGYQYIADAVLAIRNDLKQNLGIETDTRQVDWGQFLKERNAGTMPCFHLRWAADYLDPQDFLSLMLHTGAEENKVGYSNPQFDSLCDQADVERNDAKRMELYRQAERIAVDDAPWVCLYYLPDVELHKPYLRGIRDSLMGHLPHTTTTVAR